MSHEAKKFNRAEEFGLGTTRIESGNVPHASLVIASALADQFLVMLEQNENDLKMTLADTGLDEIENLRLVYDYLTSAKRPKLLQRRSEEGKVQQMSVNKVLDLIKPTIIANLLLQISQKK